MYWNLLSIKKKNIDVIRRIVWSDQTDRSYCDPRNRNSGQTTTSLREIPIFNFYFWATLEGAIAANSATAWSSSILIFHGSNQKFRVVDRFSTCCLIRAKSIMRYSINHCVLVRVVLDVIIACTKLSPKERPSTYELLTKYPYFSELLSTEQLTSLPKVRFCWSPWSLKYIQREGKLVFCFGFL